MMHRFSSLREVRDWKEVEGWQSGHNGPTRMVKVGSTIFKTGYGSRDAVHVFKEGTNYYVLAMNSSLGYIGLETFNLERSAVISIPSYKGIWQAENVRALEPEGSVFMQDSQEIQSTFGDLEISELEPKRAVETLLNYV